MRREHMSFWKQHTIITSALIFIIVFFCFRFISTTFIDLITVGSKSADDNFVRDADELYKQTKGFVNMY